MRKAERLFQITTMLRGSRTVVTAQQIAEQLEVSIRTVYRDIQALSLSNIPIQSEAGVGYRLRPGFNIPPIMFAEDELEALILGAKMVQGWSDSELGHAAEKALQKIQSIIPDSLHSSYYSHDDWLIVTDFQREFASKYSDLIRKAIKSKRIVNMEYENQDKVSSTRSVWPLGMIFWGKVWTLVAWCSLRENYRAFRLDRITNLKILDQKFETHESLSLKHYLDIQKSAYKP